MATGYRILVADKLAAEGLAYLKEQGADFDVKTGLSADELAGAINAYDAMIVRSAPKKPAIAKARKGATLLKAIPPPGVGVDNTDLPLATEKGILGMNTAHASTLSTSAHP